MKLRFVTVFVCLLAGLITGCTAMLDSAGRATPPAASGLSITRPERPAATLSAVATMCPLTPEEGTPCTPGSEPAAYPAPEGAWSEAAATPYPAPQTPTELPPATVVIPTTAPSGEPTTEAPATSTPASPPTSTAAPTASAAPGITATPRTPAPTPSDPLDRAMLAAVRIESPAGDEVEASAWRAEGLGVVLDSGQIVAPLHVLYDATTGALYADGGRASVQAYDAAGDIAAASHAVLRAWDAGLDLAVLAATSDIWSPPATAVRAATDDTELPVGAPLRIVLLVGDDEQPTRVMQTEVSGRYEDDSGPWIVAAANLSSGAVSGGVALNAAGQVVGLLQPEGGLAPGQLVRIRPIDAYEPLLAIAEDTVEPFPATLPTHSEESMVRIRYRGAEGVNLRSSPSTSGRILASLHRDEVYPIVAPGEADGWYPVYAAGGLAGWVAQRHPTGTRLIDIETQPFQSALTEGGVAEVACVSTVPGRGCANLRSTPGWRNKPQNDVVAALPAGSRLQVLSGPQQMDGLTWWEVRDAQSEHVGWIAEVTAGGYRALVSPDVH
jgi:SH3-like domain-containing protein